MIFSSLNFLFIFLPIVLILYFIVPFSIKNFVLLIASIIFYAWGEPVYVILMLLSIAFNYVAGRQFGVINDPGARKRQLVIAVIVNANKKTIINLLKNCQTHQSLHLSLFLCSSHF